ncbi:MAG: YkgJ family cysteine cluster protein [Planctomycetes bacterium]|nr:YkgJ family cysteine cluster protein [Planctomycetota bacterium]
MRTCCQTSEVYVTPGDVERIARHAGRDDFHEFRPPVRAEYAPDDFDLPWRERVFRSDGTRRVLKRRPEGDCTFLGPAGCTLPLDVRPLACRIYPFDYSAEGLKQELAPGCPLELLRNGQSLLGALEMNADDARRWHRQLYDEIALEPPRDRTGKEKPAGRATEQETATPAKSALPQLVPATVGK